MKKETELTGIPSKDQPWLKYYPEALLNNLYIPECTLMDYLEKNCPGKDVVAMHYYGRDITWETVFEQAEAAARSLRAMGLGEGDELPVFFKAVPEFIYLLLAAEAIGASLLCRDNTLKENVEAVYKAGAKVIFAHDYLSLEDFNCFRKESGVSMAILLSPLQEVNRAHLPWHIGEYIDELYPDHPAYGPQTLSWEQFLELGKTYVGTVNAAADIDRPLFRAYTSGSTGPSKQVIHSAHSMIGNMHQVNFYGANDSFRPTWLVTHLPPALVAVVVAMLLLPLASNKLLIMDPFCAPEDIDLEMMRYRPNCWPLVPMFIEIIMRSKRVPKDYDLSHLFSAGAGAESLNNTQLRRIEHFLKAHNCKARFTCGYGSSEAGSNITLPVSPHPVRDGNVGLPMPLSVVGIFKPGTCTELGYNELGEVCLKSPGIMKGYDNAKATDLALRKHDDGEIWLHTGDIGRISEDGVMYVLTRGKAPRYGGGDLATLPMENQVANLKLEGLDDEFFVIVPDSEHPGCYIPYLYVVLEEGYTLADISEKIMTGIDKDYRPVEIIELDHRPFFHFKTARRAMAADLFAGE